MATPSQENLRRVCVLDDEAEIRAFVCHVAARSGFAALAFSSTAALLESVSRESPDILVLDLALGQSDAVEVMSELARLSFRGKLLLISGRDEATLREIKHMGAVKGLLMLPPLKKPFRAAALHDRLLAEPEAAETPPAGVEQAPAISVALADALEEGWVELWYQPKIDLKSLTLCGAEALARVAHPAYGIMVPANFLPPPNDPLYLPLSAFAIRRAMADWLAFAAVGCPLKLSVNVPVSAISAPDFITLVRESLPRDPRFGGFLVEVTEDALLGDADLVKQIAAQLRLYDVFFSIDDFGQAYSSLSRLLDLSFAEVKIDRHFVDGCASDPLKGALCRTVVDLAHRFGALVCAEGVENAEDVLVLSAMGCDLAQGYFFARPMPADTFSRTILAAANPFASQIQTLQRQRLRAPIAQFP
jgi:EAL domain-containing protein (putative c-di-GMP-specific phosphodiesterase class I)/FixJ family two-component response regulator